MDEASTKSKSKSTKTKTEKKQEEKDKERVLDLISSCLAFRLDLPANSFFFTSVDYSPWLAGRCTMYIQFIENAAVASTLFSFIPFLVRIFLDLTWISLLSSTTFLVIR